MQASSSRCFPCCHLTPNSPTGPTCRWSNSGSARRRSRAECMCAMPDRGQDATATAPSAHVTGPSHTAHIQTLQLRSCWRALLPAARRAAISLTVRRPPLRQARCQIGKGSPALRHNLVHLLALQQQWRQRREWASVWTQLRDTAAAVSGSTSWCTRYPAQGKQLAESCNATCGGCALNPASHPCLKRTSASACCCARFSALRRQLAPPSPTPVARCAAPGAAPPSASGGTPLPPSRR